MFAFTRHLLRSTFDVGCSPRSSLITHRSSLLLLAVLLLPGCRSTPENHTPPAGIPDTATLVTERSGGMGFTAPEIGTIYLYNEETNQVIYKSAVNYRDQLIFYPHKDRIILNGNVVREDRSLNQNHVHRLYFVKG